MPTTFVALQCYQCSTMQVKQQKKSGNKWRCAVCNESQSVRRVFAQGIMARDLRNFVQSFNMARADPYRGGDRSSASTEDRCQGDRELGTKASVDWSEYLDLEEGNPPGHEGDDSGPKVLTELTPESFKKPKLRNVVSPPGYRQHADGRYGGSGNRKDSAQGNERSRYKLTEAAVPSHSCSINSTTGTLRQDVPEASRTTLLTKISKWLDYLTEETDGDALKPASVRNFVGVCEWGRDSWEANLDDQKVEEDVHPEFM